MVIGMVSGDERNTGSIRNFAVNGLSFGKMANIIIGKTFVYTMLYAVFLYSFYG